MRDFRAESFTSLEGAFGRPRIMPDDSQTHRPQTAIGHPDLHIDNENKLHQPQLNTERPTHALDM